MTQSQQTPIHFVPETLSGAIEQEMMPTPIPDATWYRASSIDAGLHYVFPVGTLVGMQYISLDLLVDGTTSVVFALSLQEGENGPAFILSYSALNQCSARLRLPLEATNQNRWQYPREGALLKPTCSGKRVDLARVDRITLTVLRKSEQPARWCMTAIRATIEKPPLLDTLTLPAGALIDELGQSTLHNWAGKSSSAAEVSERLQQQHITAPEAHWPEQFSRWGGWTAKRFECTGYFHTQHDGQRWWLIDPDGYPFWSTGMDCVRIDINAAYVGLEQALAWMPDKEGPYAKAYGSDAKRSTISYLASNLIRAFGPELWYERWAEITLAELRRLGFNTVANWSDWRIAQRAGFPYVRPLETHLANTPDIYRDFPDVFHPNFIPDTANYAEQLRETANDPAFIGYFLMNEPNWGFIQETPAAGMLFTTETCASRVALANFLRERYKNDEALANAWAMEVTLALIEQGRWQTQLSQEAQVDLTEFSSIMVQRYFDSLSAACREADPNHLNLGARYYTVPPEWVIKGMGSFDVFSINGYVRVIDAEKLEPISQRLQRPIMIGEWHFGALDAGLPASGIGHVRTQAARGQAFRVYEEYAAAQPWCVGTHYFTLYDEPALGRFDGENWNIGFLDVCNRPYEELAQAARATHERLYAVANGETSPYDEAPEYLPLHFF